MKLRKALWAIGVRGYRTNVGKIVGKPDLYFARARLAVFVHGCFWHGCPVCTRNLTPKANSDYWGEKRARTRQRDQKVNATLTELGIETVVIWECELSSDLTHYAELIRLKLEALDAAKQTSQ